MHLHNKHFALLPVEFLIDVSLSFLIFSPLRHLNFDLATSALLSTSFQYNLQFSRRSLSDPLKRDPPPDDDNNGLKNVFPEIELAADYGPRDSETESLSSPREEVPSGVSNNRFSVRRTWDRVAADTCPFVPPPFGFKPDPQLGSSHPLEISQMFEVLRQQVVVRYGIFFRYLI